MIRSALRQVMFVELRRDENDDVTNYLVINEEEVDQILHKKIKSLRESRNRKMQLLS